MYCKNCGKIVDEDSLYCNNCGTRLDNIQNQTISEDKPSFGFAILGFFIPLVGLILFLIYEGKKPKRAKSAGKGALIGFLTKIALSIILVILYVVFAASSNIPVIEDIFREETTEEILEKYVDVSFGKFEVTNNGYYSDTSLEITITNKAASQYTYYITIEAVDKNGTRLETDMIYADRLNAGQKIKLTAFKYVEEEKIEQFKNATFKVLEISKYDF
jgi:hypothetical protein